MSYENPPLPEGINVSGQSVVRELLRFGAALVLIVAAFGATVHSGGGWLARKIPFATELSWVGDTVVGVDIADASDAHAKSIQTYLEDLTTQVAAHMQLPEGMRVHVHYSESEAPNAFATLGGHIVVTRGLYQLMPSENALATVIAHEIAHVRARDPIAAIGGATSLALLVAVIGGDASGLAPQIARGVQLGYSRHAESLADEGAIAALKARYGHAGGASSVFEALAGTRLSMLNVPTLLSTHPLDDARIERMRLAAQGWDASAVPLRALRVDGGTALATP